MLKAKASKYKNAKITLAHLRIAVRQVWELFVAAENTQNPDDVKNYTDMRAKVEKAIAEGDPTWKEHLQLP